MLTNFASFKLVPTKIHFVAVLACLALFGIVLLLPAEPVEAKKQLFIELKAPDSSVDPVFSNTVVSTPEAHSQAVTTATEPYPEAAASTPIPAHSEEPAISVEEWLTINIRSGDNLTTLFEKANLGANQLYPMLNGIKPSKVLSRLKPGEQVEFLITEGELIKFRHIISPLTQTLISRTEDGYSVDAIELTPEVSHKFRHGSIDDSLFLSGERAGLSQQKIMELAGIFGWDVDFALDIRQGDEFSLIYEELWLDGSRIGEGEIVAAEFINQGRDYQAVRYTDSKGVSNYYTPKGSSMRKAFLRTPVDFSRISSRFNPNRKHPIFKTKRPHRGVDYAAPTGTPIKSSGDGKVISAGTKGGYGKAVIVQHGQTYNTLYAHMSRIKPGIKRGTRVKQGQTIGYVGSTGYATGPHLHYEFRVNGAHRNPLTVALPQASPLPKAERARFTPLASGLLDQLKNLRQTQLAQN
ncbi:MAG: peptidoglycan DD-metalloendopeptidase family protein [Motiliproteus sp.]